MMCCSQIACVQVFLPIIGTIGVFGNVVTIVVLTRRGMRSSTNAYLTALAIADLIYLLCVFWLSLKHYPHIRDPSMAFYAYTWPYSLWLADATSKFIIHVPNSVAAELVNPCVKRLIQTNSQRYFEA